MEPLIKELEQKLNNEINNRLEIDKVKRKIDSELNDTREIVEKKNSKIEELTQQINQYEDQLSTFNSKYFF